MKASELRIGNYLKSPEISMTEDEIFRVNRDVIYFFHNYKIKPIQLTVKWLAKANAKKVANTYILDRFLFIWKPEYGYWYVMDLDSLAYLTKIEFVHELQNFYFVMQGEELKI